MNIATLFSYLIGNRAAILRIATTRGAVWIGALLVLSAGLAREYDAADLISEPWRLLIPFGASLGTSFLLYCLVYLAAWRRTVAPPPFARTFVTFLSLYWMTAPLAWLYALPVERWMPAGDATRTNLYLLGLVSIWRVTLMVRVVHVLFGAGTLAAFWLVMLFGDTVALVILYLTPVPILNVMGGIRLTESEAVIQSTALFIGLAGGISWIVWFGGACTIIANGNRDWKYLPSASLLSAGNGPAIWCFAVCMILVWGFVLPFTQPEQRLRKSVEAKLLNNQVPEAMQIMSQHEQEDFPPHWIPPPHLAFAKPRPPLLDVMEAILDPDVAPWVRSMFLEKLEARIRGLFGFEEFWYELQPAQRTRFVGMVERLPEGTALVAQYPHAFSHIAGAADVDADLRQRARALLTKAGKDPTKLYDAAD